MKHLVVHLLILILFQNCSFDNKTGIWQEPDLVLMDQNKDIDQYEEGEEFEDSSLRDVFFSLNKSESSKTITYNSLINIDEEYLNTNWTNYYQNNKNNISNLFYINKKELIFKSSRLSKFNNKNHLNSDPSLTPLIYENHIISYDHKGTIYVYSLENKKKIYEYNFYKKKFKKYKKKIYIAVKDGIIYAADNLGYLYAININSNKILWAKNYGIPFRSNILLVENQLITSNQDNVLFSMDMKTGIKNWQYQSRITKLKTNFINNVSIDEENANIIFLNTSGELYSVNYKSKKINWLVNTKKNSPSEELDIFTGTPVIIKKNFILISTNTSLSLYDSLTGGKIWERFIVSQIKSVLTKNHLFLINNDNYIMCVELISGNTVWSQNINKQMTNNKELEKISRKMGVVTNLTVADSKIMLFTSRGFLFLFDHSNGNIEYGDRITKSGIIGNPVFAEGHLYLLDKSFRIRKFN